MDILGYIIALGPLLVIILAVYWPERRNREDPDDLDIIVSEAERNHHLAETKQSEWVRWSRSYSRLS